MIHILLLACRTAPQPVEDPAIAPVEAAPAAVAAPAATESLTVTLEPLLMAYDEAAGTATYSPGSDRRSATYHHYVLDLASLEAALGGRPEAPVAVVLEVGPALEESFSPDPNMPQPDGGFLIITQTGRVVGLAEAAP